MLLTSVILAMMMMSQAAQNPQGDALAAASPALQGTVLVVAKWRGKSFSLRQFMRTYFNIGSLMGGSASRPSQGFAAHVCISLPGKNDCGIRQNPFYGKDTLPHSQDILPLSLNLPAGHYDVGVWPSSFIRLKQSQSVTIEAGKPVTVSYVFAWPKGLH